MLQERLLLTLTLTAMATGAGEAGAQTIPATQITYETTSTRKADSSRTVVEEGTYTVLADGRYRIDKVKNGSHTAVIVTRDARTAMNLDTKQAHVGAAAAGGYVRAPGETSPVPPPPPNPSNAMKPPTSVSPSEMGNVQKGTVLDTKTVYGLTLEGRRFVHTVNGPAGEPTLVFTHEVWFYRFPDPHLVPEILETRMDGPKEVIEQRVIDVQHVQVPATKFAVPANFTVTP
jgi:hypothetical protein